MPWAVVGGAVIGAGASIYAADKASDAQAEAAAQAAQIEREQYEQTRKDLAPYRDAGTGGINSYADAIGLNGPEAQARARASFRTDPGYEFSFDEGRRAVEGSAAARGGALAGGALKDLTRFGTGLADQQYGSYLDRFLNAANLGENAAAQTGNFGSQSAGRQGAYALDAGAAKAGGYLSAAQGVNGAISSGLQLYGYGQGGGWSGGGSAAPRGGTAQYLFDSGRF